MIPNIMDLDLEQKLPAPLANGNIFGRGRAKFQNNLSDFKKGRKSDSRSRGGNHNTSKTDRHMGSLSVSFGSGASDGQHLFEAFLNGRLNYLGGDFMHMAQNLKARMMGAPPPQVAK